MLIKKISREQAYHSEIVSKIIGIEKACFDEGLIYSEELLSELLCKNWQLIVLQDKDFKIQGYCTYTYSKETQTIAITSIAVHPAFQGHNFAFQMMQETLTEREPDKPYKLVLECQPYHENYYKKFGFKAVKLHDRKDYYRFTRVDKNGSKFNLSVPGVIMMTDSLHPPIANSKKFSVKTNTKEEDLKKKLELLINFVSILRKSTSFWYSGFWHSKRKEHSFDSIYNQLVYLRDPKNMPLTETLLADSLRAIIANSLVVRGKFSHKMALTKSSRKALNLLNSKDGKFLELKETIAKEIPTQEIISHKDLISFAKHDNSLKSSAFEDYPYSHFAKN